MSVVIETTLGDITVDLYLSDRPRTCLNFLKLCAMKYYNYNLFHTISRGFIAQTGDPTGSRSGGESIYGVLNGSVKRYFEGENEPRIKHTKMGLISFVGNEDRMIGSQFFITLGEGLTYLDEKHCIFGEVVDGFDVLEVINEVICDTDDRPYQDVRITHTVILDDPFPKPKRLAIPSRSPSPNAERLQGGRIAPDEEIDETEGKTAGEVSEMQAEQEAKARATILEMVGDIPDADMAPPENVLFVCKLNPVTTDDDLEVIFNRFGKIKSCEVIRDRKTGDSLQYAFIEFEEQKSCEDAYFKMDNILIDDRRIHVDFSQSVSKVKWLGKGRGVTHYDERGKKINNSDSNIGNGNYKYNRNDGRKEKNEYTKRSSSNNRRVESPRREQKYDGQRTQSQQNERKSNNYNRESYRQRSRSPQRKTDTVHYRDSGSSQKRDRSPSRSKSNYKNDVRRHESREHHPDYDKRGASTSGHSDRKKDQSNSTYRNRNEDTPKTNKSDSKDYEKNTLNQKRHSSYESGKDIERRRTKYVDREAVKEKKKAEYSSDDTDSEVNPRGKKFNVLDNKKRTSDKSNQDEEKGKKKKYTDREIVKKKKHKSKYSSDDSDVEVEQKKKQSSTSDDSELDKKKSKKKKKKSRSRHTSSSDSDDQKTKKRKKNKKRKHESGTD